MHFVFLEVFINIVIKNLFIDMSLVTHLMTPLTNNEPIKAYKVLIKSPSIKVCNCVPYLVFMKYISPIMEFDYTNYVHSHNVISGPTPITFSGFVSEGFHLFLDLEFAELTVKNYIIGKGVIFECEIPVNSQFFMNPGKTEICTNQFRFIKEIKI